MSEKQNTYESAFILIVIEHIILAVIMLKNRIFKEMPRWLELKYRYEKI